jgi:hypothetical protein
MKVVKGLVVAALVVSVASGAFASSIAAKFWYADMEALDNAALNIGISGSLSLSDSLWLSAAFLVAEYDTPGDWTDDTIDVADGEIVLGVTASIVDLGIGARYSEWTFTDGGMEEDLKIFGPMVYVGVGNTFGYDCPLGWYAGGSYMFKDLGDAYDDDDLGYTMEHYNVEAGLFASAGSFVATLGYRYKEYLDSGDELIDGMNFSGPAGTVGFGF